MYSAPVHFRPLRSRGGFTLLEILAVLGVVVVLTGLGVGAAQRAAQVGRISRARAELGALAAALEAYRRSFGDYPQTDDPARLLQSLLGQLGPNHAPASGRPLLELGRFATTDPAGAMVGPTTALIDPWGRPYQYAYKVPPEGWSNPSFVLYSAGPDGLSTRGPETDRDPDPSQPGNADNISPDIL